MKWILPLHFKTWKFYMHESNYYNPTFYISIYRRVISSLKKFEMEGLKLKLNNLTKEEAKEKHKETLIKHKTVHREESLEF